MSEISNFQFPIFKKLYFFFKRPRVIIITGRGRQTAKEAIFQVLKKHFKIGKDVLIYETDLRDYKNFEFLAKKSRLPILVVTHVGEYHPEREFFAGELQKLSGAEKLAKILPAYGYLVLNFDDETVRDLKNSSQSHPLTFGFGARANIRVTDVVLTQTPTLGTNFKINHEGNIVPVWLEKLFGKEQIYSALAAAAVGEVLDLNLVEVSAALKSYYGLPGKMQLIEGIKKSWILDDSESASSLSMAEALSILGKIETGGRKIAVLGDILGIGKYTIEAHEAIGERVAQTADLLFTVGPRAEFFAQGAIKKGMAKDKIFQFNKTEETGLALQKEIRPDDLILIDGSKEMSMIEIVNEVKV
jgi:UDP-N-acetylmuramoyl-tripeptide--D-alanyl-D-alanine ligase